MFADEPDTILDALAAKYGLSHDARSLVEEFVNLKPDIQQSFVDYALKVARSIATEGDDSDAIPQPDATPLAGKDIPVPAPAPDIMSELAELKRQNEELAAKVAAMDEEEDEYNPELEAEVAEFRRQRRLEKSTGTSGASTSASAG